MTNPTSTPAIINAGSDGFTSSAPFPIFLIIIIIILGLLVISLCACIGYSFWSRRRARRRGEDPGPLFTSMSWRGMRRDVNGGQGPDQGQEIQNINSMTGGLLVGSDARGREFYNVPSEMNTGIRDGTWKGGDAATLPRAISMPTPRPLARIPSRHASTLQANAKPFTPGTTLVGDSGCAYQIEEILVDRQNPLLCVYRASASGQKYLMKNIIPSDFEYQLDLQTRLKPCRHVRSVIDTIQQKEIFIYPFLRGDLLDFSARANLDRETRKSILRQALQGLVDMHEQDIVHNDIKPNNILIDYANKPNGEVTVESVQIGDLEDTVLLAADEWLNGPLCGNALWRSPESWCRAYQNRASDVFSFAIVMIYVMLNRMVFLLPPDQRDADDAWRHILRRHVSYFGDEDNLNYFLQHIGTQNPYFDGIVSIASSFGTDPRRPFTLWQDV